MTFHSQASLGSPLETTSRGAPTADTSMQCNSLEELLDICDAEDLALCLRRLLIDDLLSEEEMAQLIDLLQSSELQPFLELPSENEEDNKLHVAEGPNVSSPALRILQAVPNWSRRLRVLLIRELWPRRIQDLVWAMSKLQSACSAARRSFFLRDLLQVVLVLANQSKGQTPAAADHESSRENDSENDDDDDDNSSEEDDESTSSIAKAAEKSAKEKHPTVVSTLREAPVALPLVAANLPAATPRSTRSLEVKTLLKVRNLPAPPGPFPEYALLHQCIEQLRKDRPNLTPEVLEKELGALRVALQFDLEQCRQDCLKLQKEVLFLRGEAKRERRFPYLDLNESSTTAKVAVFDIDDDHDDHCNQQHQQHQQQTQHQLHQHKGEEGSCLLNEGTLDADADADVDSDDWCSRGSSRKKATSFSIPPLALSTLRTGADTDSSTQDASGGHPSASNSAEGSWHKASEIMCTDVARKDIRPPTARLPKPLDSSALTKWVALGLDVVSFYQDWKVGVAVLGEGVHRSVLEVPSSSDPPPPGMLARLCSLGEWRQCWCEVRATLLVVYTMDASGRLILGTQYIPLPGAEVLPCESVAASPSSRKLAPDFPNSFEIQVATTECEPSQRVERFCAGTPRELAKWLAFLQRVANEHKGGYLQHRRPGWWFVRSPWQRLYCVFDSPPNVEAPCLKGFSTLRDCAEGHAPEQVWLLGSSSVRSFAGEGASRWAQSLKRQHPFGIEIEDYDTGRCLHFACSSEAEQDAWLGVLCEEDEDVVSPALSVQPQAVDVERMSLDPGVDRTQLFDLYSDDGDCNEVGRILTTRSNRSSPLDSARSSQLNTYRSQAQTSPFASPRLQRRHSDTSTRTPPPLSPRYDQQNVQMSRRSSLHFPLDSKKDLRELPFKRFSSWDAAEATTTTGGASLSQHPLSTLPQLPAQSPPKSVASPSPRLAAPHTFVGGETPPASAAKSAEALAPVSTPRASFAVSSPAELQQRLQLQRFQQLQMQRSHSIDSVDEESSEWDDDCRAAALAKHMMRKTVDASGNSQCRLNFKLNFNSLLHESEEEEVGRSLPEEEEEEEEDEDEDEDPMSPRYSQDEASESYAEIVNKTAEEIEAGFQAVSKNLFTTEADAKSLLHFFGWDLCQGASASHGTHPDESSLASDLHALLTYLSNFTDEVDVAWRELLYHQQQTLPEEDNYSGPPPTDSFRPFEDESCKEHE